MSMYIKKGREYLLHWKNNMTYRNENLEDLKRKGVVMKMKGRYYTTVIAHYTGDFNIVDCTLDKEGNFYPVHTSLLKPF